MKHAELVEIGRKWLSSRCPVVVTEIVSSAREEPDVLGFLPSGESILIEVKVSVDDVRRDAQKVWRNEWYGRALGQKRYYLAPIGLVDFGKLVNGWGLLELVNGKIKKRRESSFFETNRSGEIKILLSTLRRLKLQEEDDHVAIKVYTIKTSKAPRATLTLDEDRIDVDP